MRSIKDLVKRAESERDAPFEAPTAPPQLEAEIPILDPIADILMGAPAWSEDYAAVLAHQCRQHPEVASAIAFILEMAAQESKILRTANTIEEIKAAQGACRIADRYFMCLVDAMAKSEETQEEEANALLEQDDE